MYELRTMMINCVYDFRCTFAQLAARPGVAEKWRAHIFDCLLYTSPSPRDS